MNYSIKLDMQLDGPALQVMLRTLDAGPHGLMRSIIDSIIQQAQAQEAEAKAAAGDATTTIDGIPVDAMPN
ncbi:hypothetical protein UFOVP232_15 [uncultured Caudovirales phage]|uniref:Uncharacterized protein n=1 Tax=uncultured Caudovirales phage TaxID=2100421 RepID=A0A6J7WTF3_9CAUD|nr:hypothetical protein UFOVP232_15 [uncultured Caudovirales phage]